MAHIAVRPYYITSRSWILRKDELMSQSILRSDFITSLTISLKVNLVCSGNSNPHKSRIFSSPGSSFPFLKMLLRKHSTFIFIVRRTINVPALTFKVKRFGYGSKNCALNYFLALDIHESILQAFYNSHLLLSISYLNNDDWDVYLSSIRICWLPATICFCNLL